MQATDVSANGRSAYCQPLDPRSLLVPPSRPPRVCRRPHPYFDRITEPALVHHETRDDTRPIRWSEARIEALKTEDKDVTSSSTARKATSESI